MQDVERLADGLNERQNAVLQALRQQRGGVLSKEALARVAGVAAATVPTLVKGVRRICGEGAILTVYGKGYCVPS
jgi:DNA-binding winged helix-turn-helix (wHTH) protein